MRGEAGIGSKLKDASYWGSMPRTRVAHHSHSPKAAARSANLPRKKPRQERAQFTVEAVLDAASQVLVKAGYDKATTTRVAELAGVSVGTLYQYFPNKEALFGELLLRELGRGFAKMAAAAASVPAPDLEAGVSAMVRALLAHKAENPALHRVLKTELGRVDGSRILRESNARALAVTEQYLASHAPWLTSPAQAAFLAVNAVEGIVGAVLQDAPRTLGDPAFGASLIGVVLAILETQGRRPEPRERARARRAGAARA
jgi:AcrR family transcriptional regulator